MKTHDGGVSKISRVGLKEVSRSQKSGNRKNARAATTVALLSMRRAWLSRTRGFPNDPVRASLALAAGDDPDVEQRERPDDHQQDVRQRGCVAHVKEDQPL